MTTKAMHVPFTKTSNALTDAVSLMQTTARISHVRQGRHFAEMGPACLTARHAHLTQWDVHRLALLDVLMEPASMKPNLRAKSTQVVPHRCPSNAQMGYASLSRVSAKLDSTRLTLTTARPNLQHT